LISAASMVPDSRRPHAAAAANADFMETPRMILFWGSLAVGVGRR
jgi:hypothetical protein